MGVLDQLTPFLTSHPTHSNDLKYWALLLVHQFSLTGNTPQIFLYFHAHRLNHLCHENQKYKNTKLHTKKNIEKLHRVLLKKDLVPILARMTRLTFGNTNMQKYCLHSLVRLVSDLENQGIHIASLSAPIYT